MTLVKRGGGIGGYKYVDDPEYRRYIRNALNRGEAYHLKKKLWMSVVVIFGGCLNLKSKYGMNAQG